MRAFLTIIFITTSLFGMIGCSSVRDDTADTASLLGNTIYRYQLDAPFPETPHSATICRLIRPKINTEYVSETAERFGLTSEVNGNHIFYSVGNDETHENLLINTATGAVIYSYKYSGKLYPAEAPSLPSEETAKDIALEFLKEKGLYSSDIKIGKVAPGGYYRNRVVAHLVVCFDYYIEGLPVTGTGKMLNVRIGDGGEVVLAMWYHPTYEVTNENVLIKTPAQAYQDLLSGNVIETELDSQPDRPVQDVRITNIALGYYLEPVAQDFAYPVYIFEGEYENESGSYDSYFFQRHVDARQDS